MSPLHSLQTHQTPPTTPHPTLTIIICLEWQELRETKGAKSLTKKGYVTQPITSLHVFPAPLQMALKFLGGAAKEGFAAANFVWHHQIFHLYIRHRIQTTPQDIIHYPPHLTLHSQSSPHFPSVHHVLSFHMYQENVKHLWGKCNERIRQDPTFCVFSTGYRCMYTGTVGW